MYIFAKKHISNWSFPCKTRTGIPARFWPPGFFFLAGISPGSRQDSCQEVKFPAAKISPGSCRESCQDSHREAKIPVAEISARSCRKSCQDSCRETIIPVAKMSPESYCKSRKDSLSRRFLRSFKAK